MAIADRVMMSLGGDVISADHTFNIPSRIKSKDADHNTYSPIQGLHGRKLYAPICFHTNFFLYGNYITYQHVLYLIFLVCNGIGQVISFIWTAGTGTSERIPQFKELRERFEKFGNMDTTTGSNLPCFSFDLCCSDRAVIDGAKFHADTTDVGDVYHITKRILFAARSENRAMFSYFAAELRKCFGSTSMGVFWQADRIIAAIDELKTRYEKPDVGVWNETTTRAYENEKKHIRNCLQLPDNVEPIVKHRSGKYIVQRGTNNCESMHRQARRIFPEKLSLEVADTLM